MAKDEAEIFNRIISRRAFFCCTNLIYVPGMPVTPDVISQLSYFVRQLMPEVHIQIVEFLSSDQPGFVAATLTDVDGVIHTFHDKIPVFTNAPIDADTQLPFPGMLDCTVLESFERDGRELVRIDTEKPFDVESITGNYHFLVAADRLTSNS